MPAFRWYFGAMAVSALGGSMATLAVTFAVLGLGGSPGELGLVLAGGTVPAVLLVLIGGVAGDRWDRRRIMVGADVVDCVTMAVLATLLLTGHAQIWHLLVGQVIGGVCLAFVGPTAVGLMPTLVDEDHLQSANSVRMTTWNVASIVGPPLAALLIAAGSPGWALAANSVSFGVSALCMLRLPRSRGSAEPGATPWQDLREGWQAFVSRRWVVLMVAGFATYQATVLPAIFVLGPVLAERHFAGASTWAVVLSARAVGALASGVLLMHWKPRRPLVAASAMVLLDVPFLLALAYGLSVPVIALTAMLSSAGVLGSDTVWESTLQTNVPADVLSRVSSYDWFGSMLINPIGFALIGVVSQAAGATEVIVAAAVLLVLIRGALLLAPPIRAVRAKEKVPAATA
ncbi:MAG: MFS transporter [Nocardioidaceae bacterium]|nr:MFS transporter [Nocardioidaceae bacterium]